MTAIIALRLGRLPTADDIDRFAIRFLELEQRVNRAYRIALQLDEPYEKLKDELIDLCEEFGTVQSDIGKVLDGDNYRLSIDGAPPVLCVRSKRKR